MNIALLIITSWNFFKTLNIIFLVVITLTTIINIILFWSIGNIKIVNFKNKIKNRSKLLFDYILFINNYFQYK